jgi:site-specific recombinase XerD
MKINTLYKNDKTGRELKLPGLLTQDGLLISHLRYLADHKQGASWRERSVYAMRQLILFINANVGRYEKNTELLEAFAKALEYGTIDLSSSTDPLGLYWTSRKAADAKNLLYLITMYTDWLSKQEGHDLALANPFRTATKTEERLNWCAYYQKEENVFLRHLHSDEIAANRHKLVRKIRTHDVPTSNRRSSKRFPESEIDNLLENGWTRRCGDPNATKHDFIDYKGRALTILMHYGGLRKSEPFHWFLSDLIVDKDHNEAIVRIYHPANGRPPMHEEDFTNRRDLLERRYCRLPRTEYALTEALYAGWKSPALTDGSDGYISVEFFPREKAKEFLYNYMMYIKYQRVNPPPEHDHPYAFTNTEGLPETINNFNRQHRAAVHRIGLPHIKRLGTTEHGHRHAYGFRLAAAGMSGVYIMKAMHHKNPNSHKVYTEPSDEDVREEFRRTELY